MNESILIVDDEKEIADLIEVYLKNDGYTVHKFYNGLDALECIETQKMDLAILDVMLPDIDGFRICQKIREQYYYPIIMLTAKIEDTDKIMGLTIGADDYITKPFNPLEVVARVKTQLRRYVRYNNAANTKEIDAPIAEHDVRGLIINKNTHKCAEVIVEETINGFEVGCAVLGIDELIVGRIDEIELSSGFFDYTEKYTLKSSKIYMPARIDAETEKRIQDTAIIIYKTMGCSGFARVDMFYTTSGEIVFNEVNTIPGFTSHSRYPSMMKGIGLSFADMLDKLIGLYVK